MTRMSARYRGECAVCGNVIKVGDDIDYARNIGARHWMCQPFIEPEGAIWISIGEGYGGQPFSVGQIVHNDPRRVEKGEPLYLYVLHAKKSYVRDDGFSFGVGDESGYVYSACTRAATDEESAPLRAEEQDEAARIAARLALAQIERRIRDDGEYPLAPDTTGLTVILDKRTIYGGGYAWATQPGYVWHLDGNGGDGDNWSSNNVGSSIGRRLPDPDGSLTATVQRLLVEAGLKATDDVARVVALRNSLRYGFYDTPASGGAEEFARQVRAVLAALKTLSKRASAEAVVEAWGDRLPDNWMTILTAESAN